MSRLRNAAANLIEETAASRHASSRASARIGSTLKKLGVAKLMKWIASRVRVEDEEADDA